MSYSVVNFYRLTQAPKRVLIKSDSRIGVTLQNSAAQSNACFVATSGSATGEIRNALRIDPAATLLRDFAAPNAEIWAFTTAAGEAAGEGLTIWEDFK